MSSVPEGSVHAFEPFRRTMVEGLNDSSRRPLGREDSRSDGLPWMTVEAGWYVPSGAEALPPRTYTSDRSRPCPPLSCVLRYRRRISCRPALCRAPSTGFFKERLSVASAKGVHSHGPGSASAGWCQPSNTFRLRGFSPP